MFYLEKLPFRIYFMKHDAPDGIDPNRDFPYTTRSSKIYKKKTSKYSKITIDLKIESYAIAQ